MGDMRFASVCEVAAFLHTAYAEYGALVCPCHSLCRAHLAAHMLCFSPISDRRPVAYVCRGIGVARRRAQGALLSSGGPVAAWIAHAASSWPLTRTFSSATEWTRRSRRTLTSRRSLTRSSASRCAVLRRPPRLTDSDDALCVMADAHRAWSSFRCASCCGGGGDARSPDRVVPTPHLHSSRMWPHARPDEHGGHGHHRGVSAVCRCRSCALPHSAWFGSAHRLLMTPVVVGGCVYSVVRQCAL